MGWWDAFESRLAQKSCFHGKNSSMEEGPLHPDDPLTRSRFVCFFLFFFRQICRNASPFEHFHSSKPTSPTHAVNQSKLLQKPNLSPSHLDCMADYLMVDCMCRRTMHPLIASYSCTFCEVLQMLCERPQAPGPVQTGGRAPCRRHHANNRHIVANFCGECSPSWQATSKDSHADLLLRPACVN